MRKNRQKKNIFCIEGLWDNDLRRRSTIEPILELLSINYDIKYIYKDCATREELFYLLDRWKRARYDTYPILYIATHGWERGLRFGDHDLWLQELAERLAGECKNRIIVFASCKTLGGEQDPLEDFLERTGALAICGYRNDVPWLRSTAFECLLLASMQSNEFSGRGIDAIERKALEAATHIPDVEFRMMTASPERG